MKRVIYTAFTALLLLVATLDVANAQKTEFLTSKVAGSDLLSVNKVVASATPGEFFIFSPFMTNKTLVVKSNRITNTSDTVGVVAVKVAATALVNTGNMQVLYMLGSSNTDTVIAGIKIANDAIIYPVSFPNAGAEIKTAVAIGNTVLFGGDFTVTSGSQTFTNLAALDALGMDYASPGSAYPNGSSSRVSMVKMAPDQKIVIGFESQLGELNVQYIVAHADLSSADTIVTNFAPSVFEAWEIRDVAFATPSSAQAVYLVVNTYDTSTRAHVVFLPNGNNVTDTVGFFYKATVSQVELFKNQMWAVVSSNQSNLMNKKLVTLFDIDNSSLGNIPRFDNFTALSPVVSCILPVDSELLVGGSFSYKLTNGDTAVNTMAILITDTIAPHLFASVTADTIQVLRGSEVSWYNNPNNLFFTAYDNFDGDVAVVINGFVDSSTVGDYLLTYSAVDAAGNTASQQVLFQVYDTTTAIKEVALQVSIYPNPTKDQVMITTQEVGTYQIVNSIAQQVASGYFNSGTTRINFGELPKGIYFLRLQSDKKSAVEKILLE